ncbi:NAD(P)-dependent dehydrogenase, short-chain alcohol dehydrogenase family [Thermomonospora echinospora]|uniref:NAD(P)-dependent dehydrogenase, short-chain alcohol dehydrogenase family n=1 Tax=Thermomonospora echinospora TaxID=1992 RepID=A0A1H6DYJ1_9ACTN|nr:glucose 1-dehydrogenase [Thermomonospora echinospora]SEG89695.1 NAD(P)-dependent dehydrogenase, short-chain alcohol dehydrogenase family [Thermomonospora echinospora]
MNARFTEKVVLVTGATGGVGGATARAFAREGATVMLAGRDSGRLTETAKLIEAEGGTADTVVADLTRPGDAAAMVDAAVSRHGRLDVAFNNAGVFGMLGPVADYDEEVWDTVLATNLTGVFLSMKHEIAHMREHGGGAIVNVSSNIGDHYRLPGASAYAASKSAVTALTRTAALEYIGEGIRINAVSPGPVDTPMSFRPGETREERDERYKAALPIGRVAAPEEIAAAVLWLCSDEAAFVVGQDHVIDGGATA